MIAPVAVGADESAPACRGSFPAEAEDSGVALLAPDEIFICSYN
jgi:hypothetical protein